MFHWVLVVVDKIQNRNLWYNSNSWDINKPQISSTFNVVTDQLYEQLWNLTADQVDFLRLLRDAIMTHPNLDIIKVSLELKPNGRPILIKLKQRNYHLYAVVDTSNLLPQLTKLPQRKPETVTLNLNYLL